MQTVLVTIGLLCWIGAAGLFLVGILLDDAIVVEQSGVTVLFAIAAFLAKLATQGSPSKGGLTLR